MKKLLTALFLLTSTQALAMDFTPPSQKKEDVKAGRYILEKNHANIFFGVSHLGFSEFYGRFNDFNATINADPKNIDKSNVEVTISANSADTWNGILNEKLKGEEFFNVNKFPSITFKSTKLALENDTKGKLTGDLTFLGVTKPVTLDVVFNGTGYNPYAKTDMIGFSAVGAINRSDFGMKAYVPAVSDLVHLTIQAEFMLDNEPKYPKKEK